VKKIPVILLIYLGIALNCHSQDVPESTVQQLENLTDATEEDTEDDTYLLEMERFRKNPVNLNTTDADELKLLKRLTDLQIANLITYRNLFGNFISIYELQAIPSWDINTISSILPYVTVSNTAFSNQAISKRFRNGEHSLLLRISQILEKSKGYNQSAGGTKYLGSPQRIFFRYRYTYKNLLQYGITGDKDAGEQFGKGAQKAGFDFYSFHLFARKIGIIQSLAIGDFTVNMGQGLIQWQSLAFKKSVDVMGIKRQSPVLRPYSAAGEYYFNRGAGITLQKGKIETTAFVSFRKTGGNFVADTVNNEDFISSFLTSGYHRTVNEIQDRNNLTQTSFGGNIKYREKRWQIGINGISYHFSLPVQKRDEPYNLYAISGNNWYNASVDYSYTYKNIHLFGEVATDKNFNKAFIHGLLVSVDPRVDVSFLYRSVSAAYQAVNGNAFTENIYPANETGFYTGVSIRPASGWRIDAYADLFRFPWLKYLVDAPSYGKEYLVQLTYFPNRQLEIYSRFRNEIKQKNQSDNTTVTNLLLAIPRQNWRTQISYKLNRTFALRNRVELLWYDKKQPESETGFLTFMDFIYKPMLRPFSGVLRLQYFETGGYNSRIYAYENDVQYSFSIPPFYNKGCRYYFTLNYDLGQKISVWVRWAQTIYIDNKTNTIGSGLDEIQGDKKSEVKLQCRMLF
jgi:hypothetical protein